VSDEDSGECGLRVGVTDFGEDRVGQVEQIGVVGRHCCRFLFLKSSSSID
jgi:hypothetical protein